MYTYCFNDPLRYTDPTGNWPKFLDDFFNDLREKAAEALKAAKKLAEEVAAKAKALLLKAEAEALKAKLKAEEEIKKAKSKAEEEAKKAKSKAEEESKKAKLKAEEDARKAKDNPLTKLMKDIFEKATKSAEQAKQAAIDSAKQSDSGKNVTLSSVVKNYRQGVKDAIKSTFEGVANTVAHPIKTVQNIGTFLSGFDSHGIPNARGIQMSTSVGLSA